MCQEEPKGNQRGARREPKGSGREPEGGQKGAKGSQKGTSLHQNFVHSEFVKNGKINKLTSVKTEDKRIYITAVKVYMARK